MIIAPSYGTWILLFGILESASRSLALAHLGTKPVGGHPVLHGISQPLRYSNRITAKEGRGLSLLAVAESHLSSQPVTDNDSEFPTVVLPEGSVTKEKLFSLPTIDWEPTRRSRRRRLRGWLSSRIQQRPDGEHSAQPCTTTRVPLHYRYKYDQLVLNTTPLSSTNQSTSGGASVRGSIPTFGVVLIHPIGVGIARWFYERLLNELSEQAAAYPETIHFRMVVLSPDLLGSGTACDPSLSEATHSSLSVPPPLLNISDWSDQLVALMVETEEEDDPMILSIDEWCVVTNGGCAPIALQVAAEATTAAPVTQIVLSSLPRLPFFFPNITSVSGTSNTLSNTTSERKEKKDKTTKSRSEQVKKAYQTLCGIVGKLFWWYACRKEGKFIRTFSEKNLVADPRNLGDTWQSNCYQTAIAKGGRSQFSTFAFLAGTLQDGCQKSLSTIEEKATACLHTIRGRDMRRNQARSWFWQKRKGKDQIAVTNSTKPVSSSSTSATPRQSLREYLLDNMPNRVGDEYTIGGRVSLAHEDPKGYAEALLSFLEKRAKEGTSTRI